MDCSFRPPNADYLGFKATPEGIVETTKKAEALGFDAVFLNDHIIVKGPQGMVDSWGNTFDPLTSLGYLAAVTSTIRLGTSVLIVPYRNPVAAAKMLATLDQLSGGRVIVAVGAGWTEVEFDALGVPYGDRGARTNEYLDIWKACWAPDPVSFSGNYLSFEGMYCSPKPVQAPHPPIWVGGSSRPALRRAAKYAQVWQPVPTPLLKMQEARDYLDRQCEAGGRPERPHIRMSFRVNFTGITGAEGTDDEGNRLRGHGSAEQIVEDMNRYVAEADVGSFQINFNGTPSLGQLYEQMDKFVADVKPYLG